MVFFIKLIAIKAFPRFAFNFRKYTTNYETILKKNKQTKNRNKNFIIIDELICLSSFYLKYLMLALLQQEEVR